MYLQNLWPEVQEQENYWFFEQTFNEYVDFCVWVLQVDGLCGSPGVRVIIFININS